MVVSRFEFGQRDLARHGDILVARAAFDFHDYARRRLFVAPHEGRAGAVEAVRRLQRVDVREVLRVGRDESQSVNDRTPNPREKDLELDRNVFSLAGLGEIAFAFARQLFKQWAVGVGADGQGEEPGLSCSPEAFA